MSSGGEHDAVVVGAGPNGLAAAVCLAMRGHSVLVLEAADSVGGGTRTASLTLEGFLHDVCSAIHPMAASSPFFSGLPLAEHGLQWITPPAALAHPFDDGRVALLERSLAETAKTLGPDARAYCRMIEPFVVRADELLPEVLGPLHWPRTPMLLARFGLLGFCSAKRLAARFTAPQARGLFAGLCGHSLLPLHRAVSGAFGLLLGILGHVNGWPITRGGSQEISNALASLLRRLGGRIELAHEVHSWSELPPAAAVLLDLTPRQILRLTRSVLPAGYARRLGRFRYGPGVFKVDWALDGPIPWKSPECARAGTLHLGGTLEEIAAAEESVDRGELPNRPFVLLAQQSLFDPTRAPAGRHTGWAYCHVPAGCTADMTEAMEGQVERFAPGFRDRILARHTFSPAGLERYNANYVGGDINGGAQDVRQLFTRPVAAWDPYATPVQRMFICSSSTPPGGGVHGMCGYHAAIAACKWLKRGGGNFQAGNR